MLLIDMSNIAFSVCLDFWEKTKEHPDIQMMRHLVLNKLIAEKKKLNQYAEEVVFCFDGPHSWRKRVFPNYKAGRSSDREESSFDWNRFFSDYNQLKQEFRDYFPVKCVEVGGAEGDDIIAILAMRYANAKDVVIISADKDLIQIQQCISKNVKQYSPYMKKFLTPKGKDYDLFEHVIRGDKTDGIPNFLSHEDSFVTKTRQKSIQTAKLAEWAKHGIENPEFFCENEEQLRRFHQNRTLIDLRKIPDDIANKIVEAYGAAEEQRGKMHSYLTGNRLSRILAAGGW